MFVVFFLKGHICIPRVLSVCFSGVTSLTNEDSSSNAAVGLLIKRGQCCLFVCFLCVSLFS